MHCCCLFFSVCILVDSRHVHQNVANLIIVRTLCMQLCIVMVRVYRCICCGIVDACLCHYRGDGTQRDREEEEG